MAGVPQISTRKLIINKANAQMVAAVSVASFVTVFCLVASQAVFSQNAYQARVISAKQKAHEQLQDNLDTFNDLQKSYDEFDSAKKNVIGGSSTGSGSNDGKNSTIILDALPDKYDFPALTSSLEKILTGGGLKVTKISGTDEQLDQQDNTSSPKPELVEMNFTFTVDNSSYGTIGQLIGTLQNSIRPIQADTIELSAASASNGITATVEGHTYYQPSKSVSITKEVVK